MHLPSAAEKVCLLLRRSRFFTATFARSGQRHAHLGENTFRLKFYTKMQVHTSCCTVKPLGTHVWASGIDDTRHLAYHVLQAVGRHGASASLSVPVLPSCCLRHHAAVQCGRTVRAGSHNEIEVMLIAWTQVIFLKDGSRLELLGVENHNKLKGGFRSWCTTHISR